MPNQHSKRAPRSRPVSLRVTPAEYETLRKAADQAGQTVTDYLRERAGLRVVETADAAAP
jgi:uncharacterized protein (DUF1778 family)